VFAAADGRRDWSPPAGLDVGLLLRDTDLMALVRRATSPGPLLAVDIDSVAGLGGDDAAVEFVVERLGITVVLTRRPQLAVLVADLGHLSLLHVLAFDSTGLNRSLESHPRLPGVGTVVSPGLVLSHLRPAELASLPRPILAYGLIDTAEAAETILKDADSVAVRPDTAARIATIWGAPQRIAGGAPALLHRKSST
jgi:glycerol-3-phosphate responsive antiterminator